MNMEHNQDTEPSLITEPTSIPSPRHTLPRKSRHDSEFTHLGDPVPPVTDSVAFTAFLDAHANTNMQRAVLKEVAWGLSECVIEYRIGDIIQVFEGGSAREEYLNDVYPGFDSSLHSCTQHDLEPVTESLRAELVR